MLSLAEELLLLALDDERGSFVAGSPDALATALASAILMDLGVRGRLRTDEDGKVSATDDPVGDHLLDEVADPIARESRPRDFGYWINRVAAAEPQLRQRLLDRLLTAGTLRREERRTLVLFKSTRYIQADSSVERAIRDRVRRVVLDGAPPDERTAALLGLIRASGLVDRLFAPAERAEARRRIDELTGDAQLMQQVYGGGMQGALMTALMATMLMSALSPGGESGWDGDGPDSDAGSDADGGFD